jgi:hypothetical protein
MIRALVVLTLMLPLAGCLAEQKREAARCATEAMRAYPNDNNAIGKGRGNYVVKCMEAAGYEWSWYNVECQPSDLFITENAYCYRPTGVIGRLMLKAELAIARVQW